MVQSELIQNTVQWNLGKPSNSDLQKTRFIAESEETGEKDALGNPIYSTPVIRDLLLGVDLIISEEVDSTKNVNVYDKDESGTRTHVYPITRSSAVYILGGASEDASNSEGTSLHSFLLLLSRELASLKEQIGQIKNNMFESNESTFWQEYLKYIPLEELTDSSEFAFNPSKQDVPGVTDINGWKPEILSEIEGYYRWRILVLISKKANVTEFSSPLTTRGPERITPVDKGSIDISTPKEIYLVTSDVGIEAKLAGTLSPHLLIGKVYTELPTSVVNLWCRSDVSYLLLLYSDCSLYKAEVTLKWEDNQLKIDSVSNAYYVTNYKGTVTPILLFYTGGTSKPADKVTEDAIGKYYISLPSPWALNTHRVSGPEEVVWSITAEVSRDKRILQFISDWGVAAEWTNPGTNLTNNFLVSTIYAYTTYEAIKDKTNALLNNYVDSSLKGQNINNFNYRCNGVDWEITELIPNDTYDLILNCAIAYNGLGIITSYGPVKPGRRTTIKSDPTPTENGKYSVTYPIEVYLSSTTTPDKPGDEPYDNSETRLEGLYRYKNAKRFKIRDALYWLTVPYNVENQITYKSTIYINEIYDKDKVLQETNFAYASDPQQWNVGTALGGKGVLGLACRIRRLSDIVARFNQVLNEEGDASLTKINFFKAGDTAEYTVDGIEDYSDYPKSIAHSIDNNDIVQDKGYDGAPVFYDIIYDDYTHSDVDGDLKGIPAYLCTKSHWAGVDVLTLDKSNSNTLTINSPGLLELNSEYWSKNESFDFLTGSIAIINNIKSETVETGKVLIEADRTDNTYDKELRGNYLEGGFINGMSDKGVLALAGLSEGISSSVTDGDTTSDVRFFVYGHSNPNTPTITGYNLSNQRDADSTQEYPLTDMFSLKNSDLYITADGTLHAKRIRIITDGDDINLENAIAGKIKTDIKIYYALAADNNLSKDFLDEIPFDGTHYLGMIGTEATQSSWSINPVSYNEDRKAYKWLWKKYAYYVKDAGYGTDAFIGNEYSVTDVSTTVAVKGDKGDIYTLELRTVSAELNKAIGLAQPILHKTYIGADGNSTSTTVDADNLKYTITGTTSSITQADWPTSDVTFNDKNASVIVYELVNGHYIFRDLQLMAILDPAGGLTIYNSNSTHVFSANVNGDIRGSISTADCTIEAWWGNQALKYVGENPNKGEFAIINKSDLNCTTTLETGKSSDCIATISYKTFKMDGETATVTHNIKYNGKGTVEDAKSVQSFSIAKEGQASTTAGPVGKIMRMRRVPTQSGDGSINCYNDKITGTDEGATYWDVVTKYNPDNKTVDYYECIQNCILYNNQIFSAGTNDFTSGGIDFSRNYSSYFKISENMDFIHANTIITDKIASEVSESNMYLIKDTIDGSDTIVGGMIGQNKIGTDNGVIQSDNSKVRIFAGSNNADTAPFQVLDDGTMIAKKAIITPDKMQYNLIYYTDQINMFAKNTVDTRTHFLMKLGLSDVPFGTKSYPPVYSSTNWLRAFVHPDIEPDGLRYVPWYTQRNISCNSGDSITLSFEAQAAVGSGVVASYIVIHFTLYNNGNNAEQVIVDNSITNNQDTGSVRINTAGGYQKYSITWKNIKNSGGYELQMSVYKTDSINKDVTGYVDFRNIKLERGATATSYTPITEQEMTASEIGELNPGLAVDGSAVFKGTVYANGGEFKGAVNASEFGFLYNDNVVAKFLYFGSQMNLDGGSNIPAGSVALGIKLGSSWSWLPLNLFKSSAGTVISGLPEVYLFKVLENSGQYSVSEKKLFYKHNGSYYTESFTDTGGNQNKAEEKNFENYFYVADFGDILVYNRNAKNSSGYTITAPEFKKGRKLISIADSNIIYYDFALGHHEAFNDDTLKTYSITMELASEVFRNTNPDSLNTAVHALNNDNTIGTYTWNTADDVIVGTKLYKSCNCSTKENIKQMMS